MRPIVSYACPFHPCTIWGLTFSRRWKLKLLYCWMWPRVLWYGMYIRESCCIRLHTAAWKKLERLEAPEVWNQWLLAGPLIPVGSVTATVLVRPPLYPQHSFLGLSFTLKMEAAGSSETFVHIYQPMRSHINEKHNLCGLVTCSVIITDCNELCNLVIYVTFHN
jgi:hypothetical protein